MRARAQRARENMPDQLAACPVEIACACAYARVCGLCLYADVRLASDDDARARARGMRELVRSGPCALARGMCGFGMRDQALVDWSRASDADDVKLTVGCDSDAG